MNTLSSVFGKVFHSTKTQEDYIIRPLFDESYPEGYEEAVHGRPVAEDDCGNLITIKVNKQLYFWDHETDESKLIAESVDEIIKEAKDPEPVEVDDSKIAAAWVDPEFAKIYGISTDADGWIKRPKRSLWKFWIK